MDTSVNEMSNLMNDNQKNRPIPRNISANNPKKTLVDELKMANIFSKKLKEKLVTNKILLYRSKNND